MKSSKILDLTSKSYVVFSLLSLIYVSLLGILDPHQVMRMVQIELTNNDAISSIRGVYGGVGLTISLFLIYLLTKNNQLALAFLVMFWGSYALSRVLTIVLDGSLGDFGSNWLIIESFLFFVGATILTCKKIIKRTDELLYEV